MAAAYRTTAAEIGTKYIITHIRPPALPFQPRLGLCHHCSVHTSAPFASKTAAGSVPSASRWQLHSDI